VTPDRAAAALGGLCLLVGGAAVGVAVGASQGLWYGGFVSEAAVDPGDVAGVSVAWWYRAGLLAVSLGLLLLAAGLRRLWAGWLGVAVTGLVAGSGALAVVSASVTCSPGCPLPPYETPAAVDLVHSAASVLSVACCVFAIAVVAFEHRLAPGESPMARSTAARSALARSARARSASGAAGGLVRLSRGALWLVVPLVLVVLVGLLALGRGQLTGLAERALLLAVTAWALSAAVITTTSRPGRQPGSRYVRNSDRGVATRAQPGGRRYPA
jgi:hypothetical protein